MLTGFQIPGLVNNALCNGIKPFVTSTVKVMCPSAPKTVDFNMYGFAVEGNNWFNQDTTEDLPSAVKIVEGYIQDMIREGIDSRNIVLVGMSQGGALALYTALNTNYELGGVVGIITWLPRLGNGMDNGPVELPENKGSVINAWTPVLHINGRQDTVVTVKDGESTRDALRKAMPDYTFKTFWGGHKRLIANPWTIREIIKWLDQKTNVDVRLCWIPFLC